jgi:signal transduction histidine kinase
MISVRWRAFLAIALIFVLGSALLYTASTVLVQSQFERIETSDTEQNTERGVDALNNRVDGLMHRGIGWSNWDAAYRFAVDHDERFVVSSLQDTAVASLGVNFALFYDSNGVLVYAKGISQTAHDVAVPADLLKWFKPGSSLLSHGVADTHQGFLGVGNQALYFAARPILTGNAMGPPHGTLVLAKYVTALDIQKLADLTHLALMFYPLNASMPEDIRQAVSTLHGTQPVAKRVSAERVDGYELVNDVSGRPVLVAQVMLPRQVFSEAQNSIVYFLVVIAVVTLFSIGFSIYVTHLVFVRDERIRLKDEFFSIASHELRTPLAAIRGNAKLLQDHYGAQEDKAFHELTTDIAEASMRLIRLVTNFLDAARFEHGNVPLSPTAIALGDIGEAVVKELQSTARDKQIYIKNEIPDDLPLAYADRDRVTQVIYNLIGNAAKFTEKGGVTVSAEAEGSMVKVCITDTGRGITPEGQKILFKKFTQVKASDSTSGSGLGLYIAKLLVELMGGHIMLEKSAEHVGTTLSFTLPAATKDQIAAAAAKLGA